MRYLEVIFSLPVNRAYTYSCPEEETVAEGFRVLAPLRNRKLTGYVISCPDKPPEGVKTIKPVMRVIDKSPLFNKEIIELAGWVARLYLCSHGEALQAMLPGAKREKDTELLGVETGEKKKKYELAPQQQEAIRAILDKEGGTFYLNGVTGSGKTEVYLQVAKEVLRNGKGVIYLVPEISLTHQVVEIFIQEFGKEIAIIHSGLTQSQKLSEWNRILNGDVHCVIGARSAVFAPLRNLGLIIIDEEHEGSYKSSSTPRYHARQVAMHRCAKNGARLVLGSATPSLEAYYQIKKGTLRELRMPVRLSGGKMPAMEIVDLKREKSTLSSKLVQEIRRVHSLGRQTILFLNRRGFAYYFHCKSCGYEMKCQHCSVSLTFHKNRWQMVCHYCGYTAAPIESCPECGSLDTGYSGFGTEKIEEEIQNIFPDLVVKRVDTDAVRKKNRLQKILREFRDGEIDILLGTQMVAKGLNFPGVMLVGIISADTGLQLPDFRAAERTFALIVQVSGRAGRVIPDGKVIIQTYQPQNPAIRKASRGELESFYEEELAIRKELDFPPYARLVRLVFRGKDPNTLKSAIRMYYSLLPRDIKEFCEILGPVECPLAIIAGNFRYHLIFRTNHLNKLHGYILYSLEQYKKPPTVYLEIDIDPVSLL